MKRIHGFWVIVGTLGLTLGFVACSSEKHPPTLDESRPGFDGSFSFDTGVKPPKDGSVSDSSKDVVTDGKGEGGDSASDGGSDGPSDAGDAGD